MFKLVCNVCLCKSWLYLYYLTNNKNLASHKYFIDRVTKAKDVCKEQNIPVFCPLRSYEIPYSVFLTFLSFYDHLYFNCILGSFPI